MPTNKKIREGCDGYESFHCWDIENPHRCISCCYCGEKVKTIREERELIEKAEDVGSFHTNDGSNERAEAEFLKALQSHTNQSLLTQLQEIEDMVEGLKERAGNHSEDEAFLIDRDSLLSALKEKKEELNKEI